MAQRTVRTADAHTTKLSFEQIHVVTIPGVIDVYFNNQYHLVAVQDGNVITEALNNEAIQIGTTLYY